MFTLVHTVFQDYTKTFIIGIVCYLSSYIYIMMYTDYLGVFSRIAPYMITIDLMIVGFLAYVSKDEQEFKTLPELVEEIKTKEGALEDLVEDLTEALNDVDLKDCDDGDCKETIKEDSIIDNSELYEEFKEESNLPEPVSLSVKVEEHEEGMYSEPMMNSDSEPVIVKYSNEIPIKNKRRRQPKNKDT